MWNILYGVKWSGMAWCWYGNKNEMPWYVTNFNDCAFDTQMWCRKSDWLCKLNIRGAFPRWVEWYGADAKLLDIDLFLCVCVSFALYRMHFYYFIKIDSQMITGLCDIHCVFYLCLLVCVFLFSFPRVVIVFICVRVSMTSMK